MKQDITIRKATESDHPFIFALSPFLAEVAQLSWHDEAIIQQMQDDYIAQMLATTSEPTLTLVAQVKESLLGFIHVRTKTDGISNEVIATVPLLAVSPQSQGLGLGKLLMQKAEVWAKSRGCRLLHLEVFDNNSKAKGFYQGLGFQPEILNMLKAL